MTRTYHLKEEKEWDKGVRLLLFAVHKSIQESLVFRACVWKSSPRTIEVAKGSMVG